MMENNNSVYSIGEVSKLLGISKEMIRHYEKRGIITPARMDNNYRVYSSSDIFTLCEMQQLKLWNIDLKKIANIKKGNYISSLTDCYQEEVERLETRISLLRLRIERAKKLISLTETCKMNIGNYWVDKYDGGYFFDMFHATGDNIGALKPENNALGLYREENISFMDPVCIKLEDHSEWGLLLEKRFLPAVSVPAEKAKYYFEPSLCLCTVIDIGEFGSYQEELVNSIYEKMLGMGYSVKGKLQGVLVSRGVEEEKYSRFLKLLLPVNG